MGLVRLAAEINDCPISMLDSMPPLVSLCDCSFSSVLVLPISVVCLSSLAEAEG